MSQQLKKGKEGLNVPLTTAVCAKEEEEAAVVTQNLINGTNHMLIK